MEKRTAVLPHPGKVILWGVAGVGLYVASLYNYLLFHVLAEGFSIVVAFGVFMIAWSARRFLESDYLLFVGTAFVFVAGVDGVHTLAYRGMGVIGGDEANTATQLWIAARYLQSLSLLVAPLYVRRRLRVEVALAGYAAAVTLLLLAIFAWDVFPDCFVPGSGLTPFKKISEYVISGVLLGAMALLLRQRERFDRKVLTWLLWSTLLTIGSELAFTFYVDVYGLSNFIGHAFKIVAFYLIYEALIETGLSRPYALLFRNLKQSEETLRASEQRYRGLVEMSPEAVFVNRNQRLEYANPAALGLFGARAPDQLLGKSPYDLFHSDYHPIVRERLRTLLAGKPVPLIEARIVQVHGGVRTVEVVASPFVDRDGPAIQVILRDITDRKQAEEALRKTHEELERRVRERTAELSAAIETLERQAGQLRALSAELTLAEQRERRRLAEVLHDGLQQFLVAARVRAHMLGRSSDQGVQRGSHELVALLEEALTEARTLTGELSPPTLQKGGLLPTLEWLSRWMGEKHHLTVCVKPPAASLPVLGEDVSILLYQAVRELLLNTVKYAQVSAAEVTLTVADEELTLTVADTGVGFDPARLRVLGGTEGGFGLLGIRERLELLGGRLEIASHPGRGSLFTLTVPFAAPPVSGSAAAPAPIAASASQGLSPKGGDEPHSIP